MPVPEIAPDDGRAVARLFFFFDHGAAHVITALRTDRVRRDRGAALRAVSQLLGLLVIVSPAAASFLVRLSSLGDGHNGRVVRGQESGPGAMHQTLQPPKANHFRPSGV